ncbi:MAG: hypothetical protein WKG07_15370 [Hymenobacter sp.]
MLMATIVLTWREGFQVTVSLAKLQVELLHLPLRKAKFNVDQLLEGKIVALEVADEVAATFMRKADDMGADAGFVLCAIHSAASRLTKGMSASAEASN